MKNMADEFEIDNSSDPLQSELEDGEILQNAELVCVDQEEMERLAAEEEAHEIKFSSPAFGQQMKKKHQELLKYHIISCQDELDELRSQNASEDSLVDPKDKLHFVKYVKIDGKIMKLWECGICSKDFRHQYTLMRHLPTHTDERKFVCDVCNKAFRQMSTLSQHRAIHSNARPYVCDVCQKTFNRVSTLISHRRTHFEDKPHKCHICGKGFHQKGNLKNHLFSHTNERPYRCEICGRGFNQMSNLVVHKMKMHSQANPDAEDTPQEDRFECKICRERFTRKTLLASHEEQAHSNSKNKSLSSRKTRNLLSEGRSSQRDSNDTQQTSNSYKPKSKSISSKVEEASTSGLLIDAIQTPSMLEARSLNQTAFAVLKSIEGTPSLVKIFDLDNNKQLLIPATSEDLADCGRKSCTTEPLKKIKVAVVATVSQQMDQQGQLVVRIESIDVDQKLLESIESCPTVSEQNQDPCHPKNGSEDLFGANLGDEQIHFVRTLPDGGFEIIAEEDATKFLEIIDDNASQSEDASSSSSLGDASQIIITQDEEGHLTLEGTPLHYLFGTANQQQLQFILNNNRKKM